MIPAFRRVIVRYFELTPSLRPYLKINFIELHGWNDSKSGEISTLQFFLNSCYSLRSKNQDSKASLLSVTVDVRHGNREKNWSDEGDNYSSCFQRELYTTPTISVVTIVASSRCTKTMPKVDLKRSPFFSSFSSFVFRERQKVFLNTTWIESCVSTFQQISEFLGRHAQKFDGPKSSLICSVFFSFLSNDI